MFRIIRVFTLVFVLLFVALGAWMERSRSIEWEYVLPVNLYLINGDESAASADYLRSLKDEDFKPILTFMRDEAERYGRADRASIEIRLGGLVQELPPEPPIGGNPLEVMVWSLKMRWWAYRITETTGPNPQVKMFLLYFDPAQSMRLKHSTGLQRGLVGRVNLFASRDMAKQNNVIITHELMHTLGATDKYDPATNLPLFPDGYANPDLEPRLPQRYAEIMGGRTPITQDQAEIPAELNDTLIGIRTAREINWLEVE